MNLQDTVLAQSPAIYVLKTCDSEFIEFNDSLLRYTGFRRKDIMGLTDFDCPWGHLAHLYRQQELDALNGNVYNSIQPACDSKGRQFFLFNTRYPWMDANGDVVGIMCHGVEVVNPDLMRLAHHLIHQGFYGTGEQNYVGKSGEIKLTERQEECLYLLLQGKTSKAIAQCLKIDTRTVDDHIDTLKIKFEVDNRIQLAVKAVELGYSKNIPKRLYGSKLQKMLEA